MLCTVFRSVSVGRMTNVSLGAVCLAFVWMCAANAHAQCSGELAYMSCNVQYWCEQRVGAFPFSGWSNDCICLQLCQDAWAQGEGSSCTYALDQSTGRRWYSITFDKEDGDNYYRGTVFCDPKGRPGRSRKMRTNVAASASTPSAAADHAV